MVKPTLKYAGFCGFFLIALFFVSLFLGLNPLLMREGLLFDVLTFLLFIYAANREFKVYHNQGILHFWQGMTIGFIVYSIAIAIFLLIVTIYFMNNFDYLEIYRQDLLNVARLEDTLLIEEFGEEGYHIVLQKIEQMNAKQILYFSFSPPSVLLKKIFAAFLVTPVISLILRKNPN